MNIVACPKCAAQFDVSTFQPGSTFVCGSCGNVLTVPGAQAPQRPAAPQRPPAGRPAAPQRPAPGPGRRPTPGRAGSAARPAGKRVDPRRAGGAAPAAPAAPPSGAGMGRKPSAGRRATGGSRRGGYEKPEKSNLPLVLGGVGAVVVIVVIIAVIAFTGGGDDPVGPGPDVANNGSGDGGTQPAGPTRAEVRKKLNNQIIKYGKDVGRLHSIFEECKKEKFTDLSQIAALAALKEDEDLEWANEAVGRKDLEVVYGKLPGEDDLVWAYKNEALRSLEDQMLDTRWVEGDDYTKAESLLGKVLDHAQKLRNDQKYVDIWQIRSNVAAHPFYSEFPYSVKSNYPYVVFVQSEKDKGAISDDIVDRNVRILKRLYDEFHRIFGERFDLPKLEDRVIPSERTLKVFTLASEKKFHEYQRRIGQPLPGGVRAYYKPSDQWITLFEGGQWEKSAKKGESSFNINKIFHEGTHQLMHVYTKILMERAENPDDPDGAKNPQEFKDNEVNWVGKGVHSEQHWFQEGFAELFAASKPSGDSWDLLQMHRNRLQEWKRCRAAKKDEWPFEVLVRVSTRADMQRKAFDIGLNRMEVGRLGSLFYAQAWVFCHYLWFGEDGAHREKFLEYMGSELSGKTGYRYWKKIWGNEDWKPLGEKVDKHFDKLCKEMGV